MNPPDIVTSAATSREWLRPEVQASVRHFIGFKLDNIRRQPEKGSALYTSDVAAEVRSDLDFVATFTERAGFDQNALAFIDLIRDAFTDEDPDLRVRSHIALAEHADGAEEPIRVSAPEVHLRTAFDIAIAQLDPREPSIGVVERTRRMRLLNDAYKPLSRHYAKALLREANLYRAYRSAGLDGHETEAARLRFDESLNAAQDLLRRAPWFFGHPFNMDLHFAIADAHVDFVDDEPQRLDELAPVILRHAFSPDHLVTIHLKLAAAAYENGRPREAVEQRNFAEGVIKAHGVNPALAEDIERRALDDDRFSAPAHELADQSFRRTALAYRLAEFDRRTAVFPKIRSGDEDAPSVTIGAWRDAPIRPEPAVVTVGGALGRNDPELSEWLSAEDARQARAARSSLVFRRFLADLYSSDFDR